MALWNEETNQFPYLLSLSTEQRQDNFGSEYVLYYHDFRHFITALLGAMRAIAMSSFLTIPLRLPYLAIDIKKKLFFFFGS